MLVCKKKGLNFRKVCIYIYIYIERERISHGEIFQKLKIHVLIPLDSIMLLYFLLLFSFKGKMTLDC